MRGLSASSTAHMGTGSITRNHEKVQVHSKGFTARRLAQMQHRKARIAYQDVCKRSSKRKRMVRLPSCFWIWL